MSTLAAERLAAVILAGVAKHQAGGHDQHLGGKYDQHALASALASALTADLLKSYNPRQPRDSHGRWTSTGGGAASSPPTPLSATSPGEPDESDERDYALWGAVADRGVGGELAAPPPVEVQRPWESRGWRGL